MVNSTYKYIEVSGGISWQILFFQIKSDKDSKNAK